MIYVKIVLKCTFYELLDQPNHGSNIAACSVHRAMTALVLYIIITEVYEILNVIITNISLPVVPQAYQLYLHI